MAPEQPEFNQNRVRGSNFGWFIPEEQFLKKRIRPELIIASVADRYGGRRFGSASDTARAYALSRDWTTPRWLVMPAYIYTTFWKFRMPEVQPPGSFCWSTSIWWPWVDGDFPFAHAPRKMA